MIHDYRHFNSNRARVTAVNLLLVSLLLLGFGLRIHQLEADAPLGVSPTPELSLDGPATISSGRDLVLFGTWQPFPGPRQPYIMYPFMNWVAFVFFRLTGVGYWQANFISVVFGLFAVALVIGFARQQFGQRAACFAGLFMAIDYVFIIYNRDPMAYTAVATGMMLSLYTWGRGWRHAGWFFLSGAITMFVTLFIKMPAVVFLPAAFIGFIWHIAQSRTWRQPQAYRSLLLFGLGVLFTLAIWAFFLYQPQPAQVGKAYYFRTANTGIDLEANIRAGLASLLYMGVDFGFVWRLLPVFILAYGYVLIRLLQLTSQQRSVLSTAEVVLLAFLMGTLGMLLVSFIRPLRFQIILIPLLCLVAGLALDRLWQKRPFSLPTRFGRLFPLSMFAGLAYFLYQICAGLLSLGALRPWASGFAERWYTIPAATALFLLITSIVLAIPLVFLYLVLAMRGRLARWFLPLRLHRPLAAGFVLTAVFIYLFQYTTMLQTIHYSTVTAARQIAEDLPVETTILGGPYAYALALESAMPAIWLLRGDEREVLKYKFTHLIVDVDGPYDSRDFTETRLRDTVPELFMGATLTHTYLVRGYTVNVYQIP